MTETQVNWDIQLIQPEFTRQFFDDLLELSKQVFGHIKPEYLQWRMENMPDVTIFTACRGELPVGFKAGYAVTNNRYYSWLGGINPACRRQGIATGLMEVQHGWLKRSAYDVVETHVRQDNAAMINANLKHGFGITGMFLKSEAPNYIMQRQVS